MSQRGAVVADGNAVYRIQCSGGGVSGGNITSRATCHDYVGQRTRDLRFSRVVNHHACCCGIAAVSILIHHGIEHIRIARERDGGFEVIVSMVSRHHIMVSGDPLTITPAHQMIIHLHVDDLRSQCFDSRKRTCRVVLRSDGYLRKYRQCHIHDTVATVVVGKRVGEVYDEKLVGGHRCRTNRQGVQTMLLITVS